MNFSIKRKIAAIKDDRLQEIIIGFGLTLALLSTCIYGLLYPMLESGNNSIVLWWIGIIVAIVFLFICVKRLLKFKANKDNGPQNENIRLISRLYGDYDKVCDEIDAEVNNPKTFIMRQSEIIITKKWLIHDCHGYGVMPIPVRDIIWIEICISLVGDIRGEQTSYMKFFTIKGAALAHMEGRYIMNLSNWFRENYPSVVQGGYNSDEYGKVWKKDAKNFASYFTLQTVQDTDDGTVAYEWLRNDKVLTK